jgi:Zn-dependent protease
MAAAKPTLAGSLPIFTVGGIRVYVHWSWLLVGYLELQFRTNYYDSQVWNVAEYLTLFAIVLAHEFGHALACRQVGGRANEIVLWPLGGIAFVSPPPRPGAWLWSIAAGPLVNVLLVPLTVGAWLFARTLPDMSHDVYLFVEAVMVLNLFLLLFNLLPIYPLDGGQILQALLWFIIGRAASLMVVSVIGMAAAIGIIAWAVSAGSVWFGVLAVFVALRCLAGFQQAWMLALTARATPRPDAACPACRAHPPVGNFWACDQCHARYDTFAHQAACPRCGKGFPETVCHQCHQAHPIADWFTQVGPPAAADGKEPGYGNEVGR